MDKETALDKIAKCLRLAKSANEHEAAAALRQAQKLMEMYRLTDTDVLASTVGASEARAGATRIPANWESGLARVIGDAFGCMIVFMAGRATWKFIGVGAAAEVAQYAFVVLFRQLRAARAAFIKSECKRLKPASKTRRADLFCDAWVASVARTAQEMARQPGDGEAIAAYLQQHHPSLAKLDARDRNVSRTLRERDWDAVAAGAAAGRRAQLNRGIGAGEGKKLIGS